MLKITVKCPSCGTQSNVYSGTFGIFPNEIVFCNDCEDSYSVSTTTISINKHLTAMFLPI